MQPVLETERLRLRPWRSEDIGPYAGFCASERTARYVGGVSSREDAWRRMAVITGHCVLRGYGLWALEDKVTGAFVGYSGLWNPLGWPEPEIAWGLVEQAHGRGYATEAARRARDFAYEEMKWTTAISLIHPDNTPSQRVAERLGATLCGTTELKGTSVGVYRHPGPGTKH